MLKTIENEKSTAELFAWHGWSLQLPARWNPVKLEGNGREGSALFADLHRPRLGIRWKAAGKKFEKDVWMKRAMRDEVGQLAAEAASPVERGLLFIEPEPPGRDVFVMHSAVSNRVLQVVYHAHRRERILQDAILPTLVDMPREGLMPWAVFDLSCCVDARFKLLSHQLNAGDLTLRFGAKRESLSLRQISVAQLALKKMSAEKWLANFQERHYAAGKVDGVFRRRRRFFWMFWLPREMYGRATVDETRDRLLLVSGSNRAMVESMVFE